ncbi:MAG: M50 family metallopeptidase [Gemmataceae bacterium]
MPDDYDISTCYHEAGHAVMALVMGRSIQKVSAVPNSLRLGAVEFKKGPAKGVDDWIEAEILIALAGPLAEAKFMGQFDVHGAGRDLRVVRKYAEDRVGPRQVDRYERRMLTKTDYLLNDDDTWAAVELIANELFAKGMISGRAARHLFDQATSK